MSKEKRLKLKRERQKKINIREMALRRNSKAILGSDKLMERMIRDHQDVLQNIEFILVTIYRKDYDIDDHIIANALRAAITGNVTEDNKAISLNEDLEAIRQFRSDVSDDTWRDGLRTLLQSIHRHSSLEPGSTEYLDFVSEFIL